MEGSQNMERTSRASGSSLRMVALCKRHEIDLISAHEWINLN